MPSPPSASWPQGATLVVDRGHGGAGGLPYHVLYSEVAAWVFAYIFKAVDGSILSTDPKVTGAAFGALISDPLQSLLWQWLVLALMGGILLMGVSKGSRR